MSKLPDCMMPDGAEPCKGFQELYAENERLRAERERLCAELDFVKGENERLVGAAEFGTNLQAQAVAVEQERCARVIDKLWAKAQDSTDPVMFIAAAIRERRTMGDE